MAGIIRGGFLHKKKKKIFLKIFLETDWSDKFNSLGRSILRCSDRYSFHCRFLLLLMIIQIAYQNLLQ